MAITLTQRILDLAVAGLDANQIAHALGSDEPTVIAALSDLSAAPSGQSGAVAYSSIAVSGDLTAATFATSGNADVGGTLGVDGAAVFDSSITADSLSVGGTTIASTSGNTDVNGTLGVDGNATFDGSITAASLSVAGTVISASTGNTDVNGTLGVDGAATFDGAVAIGGNATVTGNTTVTGTFGCNGATAQAASSAYTKTYSTAARTIPAATAVSVATTGSTSTTPFGYTQAQADAIVTNLNALIADNLALKKLIVALVDDLQAVGIAG